VFTGLIQDLGTVLSRDAGEEGTRLRISTELARELAVGDSIAVSGACLTATEVGEGAFAADVIAQTLSLTSLGTLREGDRVNLELPLRAGDRLGGHVVQGHIDGTGEVRRVGEDGFSRRLRIAASPPLLRYVVERGSIAVDGVSLTISGLGDGWFEVSLIPETLERTTLGRATAGSAVNLECDLFAKYVERLVSPFPERGAANKEIDIGAKRED
jgi:riboflavin synthase